MVWVKYLQVLIPNALVGACKQSVIPKSNLSDELHWRGLLWKVIKTFSRHLVVGHSDFQKIGWPKNVKCHRKNVTVSKSS